MKRELNEEQLIHNSKYLSRDLSWLKFNYRVLEQAKNPSRTLLERLKFLAISASNLDEFMMIRVGSLYNYIDYNKVRYDYTGLREIPFKNRLFAEIQKFAKERDELYTNELLPLFSKSKLIVSKTSDYKDSELRKINYYFSKTIFPMLTPMVFDGFHSFPVLMNKALTLGVVTNSGDDKDPYRFSFIQIPQNLPRFFELEKGDSVHFIPIENIIEENLQKLYKNVEILSVSLFRLTRNGDFNYDDYDESEVDFVEEIQKKLKKRKTGRVVRMEIREGFSKELIEDLKGRYNIGDENVFKSNDMIDYSAFWQIVGHKGFEHLLPKMPSSVAPLNIDKNFKNDIMESLKERDVLLHHPFNNMDPVIQLLEQAAVDPGVLAIKITIYRLAKASRIAEALLTAAENGKHVSVLFEVKARFDEENNIKEGQRLQKAGCYVIYGVGHVKTHTKLMMIVRKEKNNNIVRYVHMSSGNYNEATAKIYTDTSLLTTKRVYCNDVNEFFNVITGHSMPSSYRKLITTPGDMRKKLVTLIRKEASNAKMGLPSGIVIKVNSFEDGIVIDELYKASQVGVPIKLIVRGICCLRPGRKGLSENITVKSIVGDFLEHARIYYFHNGGDYKVYGGSADIMVRSFDRRIESLFLVEGFCAQQFLNIIDYNLRDTVNSFNLNEDGSYTPAVPEEGQPEFNLHKEFFHVTKEIVEATTIF